MIECSGNSRPKLHYGNDITASSYAENTADISLLNLIKKDKKIKKVLLNSIDHAC
mgnify:CR=1 FL=1